MNSILITDSGINTTSGGGIVSRNLVEALQSCTSLKYIFSGQKFPDNKYRNIPAYTMNPQYHGYTDTDPFFMDYLAFHILPKNVHVDLAQTYGCPHGLVVEELKREFHAKIVTDLAPHNIDVSREEHMKYVGKYPYPHLTNDMLWSLYSRHLRLADRVIVHSHSSAEYIKEKAKIRNDPIVIPHGTYIPETTPSLPEQFTPGYFGACLSGDAFVFMANGTIKTMKDLQIGDRIWGHDIFNNKQVIETVIKKDKKTSKNTFKIITGNRSIVATDDHLFLLLCNKRSKYNNHYHWTELKDLQKGDTIVILRELTDVQRKRHCAFNKEITCGMMKIMGCYIGDGYHRRNCEFKLYLPIGDKFREKYKQLLPSEFDVEVKERKDCLEVYSKKFVESFIKLGFFGNSKTKRIPKWVFTAKKCHIESFIEGLLDADGHYEKNGTCKIGLANEELMKQLQMLAIQIGIKTENIREVTQKDTRFNDIRIHKQWVMRMWFQKRKKDNREKIERLSLEKMSFDVISIKDIIDLGCQDVYDITLNNSHTFFANGFLTHNCGLDKGVVYMAQSWINCPYNSQMLMGGQEAQTFRVKDEFMHRFKVTGFIENLYDFYKQISIYIQSSVIEGFGLTPLEAMSFGRPVIVAQGAGMSELLTDGRDGFIVPVRDIQAIKDKIIYFHDNPAEIVRMGGEARKTAEKYSWDIIKGEYVKVYQELLR